MAIQKITADVISSDAITTNSISDSAITAAKLAGTLDLTGKTITVATASSGDNDTSIASTAFVQQEISALVDSSPDALNTLNELAAALGDDANFSTTVTNSIALKAPLASPDFTGDATFDTTTLVVDATNNRVGIGTTSPDVTLDVVGNARFDSVAGNALRLDRVTSGNNIDIDFYNPIATAGVISRIRTDGDGLSNLFGAISFHTGTTPDSPTEAMRINRLGNVGIGTSSPTVPLSIRKVHATGYGSGIDMLDFKAYYPPNYDTETSKASIFVGTSNKHTLNTHGGYLAFKVNQSGFSGSGSTNLIEAMRIEKDGNVGIGTDNPDTLLHLSNNGTTPATIRIERNDTTISDTNIYGGIEFEGQDGSAASAAGIRGKILGVAEGATGEMALTFETAGSYGSSTERMRIDSSGNVGIGETNPTKLGLTGSSTGKVLALGGDDCQLRLTYTVLHHDHSGNTTTHLRNHYGSLDALARMKLESGYISFHTGTAFTEGMRVDSGGRLLINQTSSNLTYGKLQVSAGGETAGHGGIVGFFDTDVSVGTSNLIQRLMFTGDPDATGGVFIRFSDSNSTLGQITAANGTQCSYGVSSDERLKENIVDASSQLDLINNIRVREFDWKVNGYHEVGMIAQELNTVVPSVVQEGGDDITEQPWTVDYGKLTPYLIKAIQEQQTIIEDLKSRIEALEG